MGGTIPDIGNFWLGDYPAVEKVARVRLVATASKASDTTIDTSRWDVEVPVFADTSANQVVELLNVPAGTIVHDILFNTADTWGASSDVVEITVGDTGAADGYLTDTILNPVSSTAAGTLNNVSSNSMTWSKGRYYAAAGTIEATIVPATSDAAATGRTDFFIIYSVPV